MTLSAQHPTFRQRLSDLAWKILAFFDPTPIKHDYSEDPDHLERLMNATRKERLGTDA